MTKKHFRQFVWLFLAMLGMTQSAAAFKDIKVDLTNGNLLTSDELVQWQQLPDIGIAIAEDGTVSRVAADDANAAAVLTGKWHSNEHGWANFKATVSVEGPVKISMGTCAWGGDVKVTNGAGETVGTFNTNTGACYHNDTQANIVSFNYTGDATTLTIEGGNYTPYFAVEELPQAEGTAFQVDLMNGNLLTSDELVQWQQLPDIGIAVAADGTVTRVAADDASAVAVLTGKWHSNEHGWAAFKAVVPVQGAVKITFGTCAWGGNVTVKNAAGEEVVDAFSTNTGACYHNDTQNNIVSAYYKGDATTLTIEGGSYVPYFAVEPVAEWQIPNDVKITFTLPESVSAEGKLPADATIEYGSKYTIPQNHTLYAAGKTLTGWTDGSEIYAADDEITVKEDITLKAIFTDNSVTLDDSTAPVVLTWQLGNKNNGNTKLEFQGNSGIMVTQGSVKGKTIDVKMDIDATSGKLNNAGRSDEWAQVNSGTKITVPSAKGAVIEMNAYNDITTTTINGNVNYTAGKTITTTIEEEGSSAEIVIGDGSYYSYITATLPAAQEAEPATWKDVYVNLVGSLLKTSERTEGVNLEFGIAIADDGTQTRVDASDPSANVVVKGVFHDDAHGWTKAQAIIKVDGPVKIGVGNCQYGQQDASYVDAEGNTVEFQTAKNCWNSSNPTENTTYVKYTGGATTLTINGASYTPYFSIEAIKTTMDNESVTATFPFNLGTDDQKADFGEAADFFLTSKVVYGSTLSIAGTQTHSDVTETTFKSSISNEDNANDNNVIKFLIRPYPGLTFTPTKVSFNASRYGTDSGNLDIAWLAPDGSTTTLATGEKMNRNNSAEPSAFSYVIENATAAEGECGLLLNLYNVYEGKQMGFANIVIEGILNGTKQEIPVLTSFVANGVTYDVEKTFAISGDDYVAEIELFKDENMISESNPISDIVVKEGQLGTVTYEGDDSKCIVTIPVTHNNITMNWVANFVRKPYYTLTFYDVDGTSVIGTQEIEKDVKIGEFAYGAENVTVADGCAFRGWATAVSGSTASKYSVNSTFTENTNLYAFVTPIEVATTTARFDYDLTNVNFDPADHEMITFEGSGYWHDKQHGWAFGSNDKITFTMAGKGYIKLGLCLYSGSGDLTLSAPDGTVIGTVAAKADADGATATIQYDGSYGACELTLTFPGTTYIHNMSIQNMEENPYTQEEGSKFIIVKRGDNDVQSGKNLLTVLELANGLSGTDRYTIFLPNGTYDFGETVLTAISRSNLSIVGQSMEGTIIKNAPDKSIEGIGTTATLVNTSTGLYLQDLTLQNALDYYGAVSGGQVGGRAVCLQDKGKQTIAKNVRMLSYQDTYYSNSNSQFYWETSEIHGTVDYLCGGGDVYYNEVTFVNESRKLGEKNGSDVIAAPYTDSSNQFGYVFNNCTIENKAASFSLGRSWGGLSKLTYLNTTINQPDEIVASRFTEAGMNIAAYSFKEYNSLDTNGNVVSPSSNVLTFTHSNGDYTYETILNADEAAEYTLDKVFPEWTPDVYAAQVAAPSASYADGTISWTPANDGAIAYALFKNNELVDIVEGSSYAVENADQDSWTIRAANSMGGFGEAAQVSGTTVGLNKIEAADGDQIIYTLQGVRVNKTTKGVYIINGKKVVVK